MTTARTVDQVDAELDAYRIRRADTLDQLVSDMRMLNAIDHRVDVLLDRRTRAQSTAAHPPTGV